MCLLNELTRDEEQFSEIKKWRCVCFHTIVCRIVSHNFTNTTAIHNEIWLGLYQGYLKL